MTAAQAVFFAAAPTVLLALLLFSLRRELHDNWRGIALLALAVVLFRRRIIFLGEAISQSDANLLQLQFFTVYREAITAGALPFWNAAQGAGLPNLAHPLSAMWYPLTPVFLAGSVYKAMSIFIVLHYFIAGLFALLLGRRVFRKRPAAFTFALLWTFNGWAVTRAAHQPAIEYLFAYAWLAMVMFFFERALDGEHLLSSAAGAGAGLAWMAVTCPNFFVYACLFLGVAAALRILRLLLNGRRNAAALAVFTIFTAGAFAVALSAVELVGAFELSLFSTGGRLGEIFPQGWRSTALSPWQMLRLFFPYTGARPFGVYYSPGVAALAAAVYAVAGMVRRKGPRELIAGLLVVLFCGAALLSRSPLYDALGGAFDLVARASLIPAGLIFLFLPVVALAGIGVEMLIESRRRLLGGWGWLFALVVFAELFTVFSVIYPRRGERVLTWNYRREVADFPHLDAIAAEAEPGRLAVYGPREGHVLAPSYATAARGLHRLNLNESMFSPDAAAKAVSSAIEDLDVADLEVLGVGWVASLSELPGQPPTAVIHWPGCMDHKENSLWWPLRNRPAWMAWDRTVRLYRVSESPALIRTKADVTLEDVLAFETGAPEYFDPWQPVRGEKWSPGGLAIVLPEAGADPAARRCVFAAVTAYPGWRWTADGREVEWKRAGGGFMAAEIPADTRRLVLRFRPTRWWLSLAASAGAFLFGLGAVIHDARRSQPS